MNKRWMICSHDGKFVTIKIINIDTGELETMEFYTNPQAAYNALALINEEDVRKYGAHVREVVQA